MRAAQLALAHPRRRPAPLRALGVSRGGRAGLKSCFSPLQKELAETEDAEAYHRKLVECNVVEQAVNIFKTGIVQRARRRALEEGTAPYAVPRVHGLVFDPAEGILNPLKIDFKEVMHDYEGLYDLH